MSFPFLIGFRNNEPPVVEEIEKQRGDFVIVHPDQMTVQRVSVALQRAIGKASVLFNRRARAFPAARQTQGSP